MNSKIQTKQVTKRAVQLEFHSQRYKGFADAAAHLVGLSTARSVGERAAHHERAVVFLKRIFREQVDSALLNSCPISIVSIAFDADRTVHVVFNVTQKSVGARTKITTITEHVFTATITMGHAPGETDAGEDASL